MNRLPQVFQNEIWEYVRGDREYWKKQLEFSHMIISKFEGDTRHLTHFPEMVYSSDYAPIRVILEKSEQGWNIRQQEPHIFEWRDSTDPEENVVDYRDAFVEFINTCSRATDEMCDECGFEYYDLRRDTDDTMFDPED